MEGQRNSFDLIPIHGYKGAITDEIDYLVK